MAEQQYLYHPIPDYTLRTTSDDAMDHLYQGTAGEEAFEVVGFLVSRRTTENVFAAMNVSQSADKGIVVAALDEPDLSPLEALLHCSATPQKGLLSLVQTVCPPVEMSLMKWALPLSIFQMSNQATKPGSHRYRWNDLQRFPAGDSVYTVNVEADAVSIVVFTCE